MSILHHAFGRIFGTAPDPREALRPLWHRIVAIARETTWYRDCAVADTLAGRFDMVTTVLALALIRMEGDPALAPHTALLTELFVEDMDGQLRESGLGDVVVGKHVGRQMAALGGRLGAYRMALSGAGETLTAAARRNITLIDGADADAVANRMERLHENFTATAADTFLAGEIAR